MSASEGSAFDAVTMIVSVSKSFAFERSSSGGAVCWAIKLDGADIGTAEIDPWVINVGYVFQF